VPITRSLRVIWWDARTQTGMLVSARAWT